MKTFALGLILVLSIGCASAPPAPSPAGARLAQANEVVVAIGTLQHAAIELNKVQTCGGTVVISPCQPVLSDANTRIIVEAVTDGLTTIRATPDGWKATASALLDRIAGRLDAAGKSQLAAYVQVVKTIAGL